MKVKTGDLKNNLSRYLKRLAQTGESITILDRDRPVARITRLRGARGTKVDSWTKERADLVSRALKKGVKLRLSESEPLKPKLSGLLPSRAPDGKTDIDTVSRMRKEKDY